MSEEILFISDLHLSLEKPEITRRFLDFLEKRATQASSLYILGDLFDAWIGDDDPTPPNFKIRNQFKQLTQSGTAVYFQPGNRDFLLGKRFCLDSGITLLDDYAVIELMGLTTLLTHGDLLCTDDLPYQAFRTISHTIKWQQNVLSKPLLIRILAARWYRFRSYLHKRKKSQSIMDVNQEAVIRVMQEHDCLRLIHGHTHRPNIHDFLINNHPAQRFVLSAWSKETGEVLCWNNKGYQIETL